MTEYTIRPLDASTWDAFAELVERSDGIYGGCWCIAFHREWRRGQTDPRRHKEQLVREGRAHAALVIDEPGHAQGWCQYGTPDELKLKHEQAYRKDPPPAGREAQGRFPFTATVELFEQLGFARGRQVGKHAWIVSRAV